MGVGKYKGCNKAKWQGLERFIGFIIGGSRVYGQSDKAAARSSGQDVVAVGDCRSEEMLGECKSYDPVAGNTWRKENPYEPARSFRIDLEWLEQIRDEAKSVDKLPFIAYNRKFSQKTDTHIILDLDVFIHLLYKAGYTPYENLQQAVEAWKNRPKPEKKVNKI
jgi:hypothetical protein